MPHPWPHPACLPDEELLAQCEVTTGRSGGPGGQHRNKVETLVRLKHRASGVESHAGERRSQIENKHVALRRLRLALAIAVRTPVPSGEIGSELWRSRRRAPRRHELPGGGLAISRLRVGGGSGRIEVSPEHHDYPCLLAEALDVIAASGWDPKLASLRLDVSASQLVKLVKDHPPALLAWNQEREASGQRALK